MKLLYELKSCPFFFWLVSEAVVGVPAGAAPPAGGVVVPAGGVAVPAGGVPPDGGVWLAPITGGGGEGAGGGGEGGADAPLLAIPE